MQIKLNSRLATISKLLIISIIVIMSFVLPVQAQEPLPDLFSDPGDAAAMDVLASSPEVLRSRWTEVDFGLVAEMGRSGSAAQGDDLPDFYFNLFEDVRYPAYIRGVEEMSSGAVGLYGTVSSGEISEFVLVVQDGVMQAYLQDGIETYEVRYQAGGHLIVEVDSSVYPDSLPPLAPPTGNAGGPVQADSPAAADTAAYIDVLAVYTPRAKNTVGGRTAMETKIQQSILSTNQGYANSGITQRVRLVGMEEVNYEEILAGVSDIYMWYYALDRLTFGRTDSDSLNANYLADARAYRDAYGADLVFMITDLPYAACGLGWLGGDPGDAYIGYSIEHWNCAGGTAYSVQHEMGHNMGACHDRLNTSTDTMDYCYASYSFGYQQQAGYYYTVMAYANGCVSCGRANLWSNPNVYLNGQPAGVDVGYSNSAYNALSLNNSAINVANYRQSVASPIMGSFLSPQVGKALIPRTVLNISASSMEGSITKVTYRAKYSGAWHALYVDTNPGDGWAYVWPTGSIGEQVVTIQAVIVDSAANSRTISLVDIALTDSITTAGGFESRQDDREATGESFAPSVPLEIIPVDPAELQAILDQRRPLEIVPNGARLPIYLH